MKTLIGAVIFVVAILGIIALFSMDRTPTTGQVISEELEIIGENGKYIPESIPTPPEDVFEYENAFEYDVKIVNYAYSPISRTIHAGSKVTWENRDDAEHTITSKDGNILNSPLIKKGEKYTYFFGTPGIYEYYCTTHPYMTGKIIVE